MARNFYKNNGSYFYTDTNQRILNIPELQEAARAGGVEIQAPQTPPGAGNVEANPLNNTTYNQINNPAPVPNPVNTQQTDYGKFGMALMDLLKQQQQLGTRGFAEQQFNAQEAQNERVLAKTPDELIGANPSLQGQVRSASAGALQPTIAGANQSQRTFSEQIAGLGNALQQAQGIGQWLQGVDRQEKEDALDLLFKFPDAIKGLDEDAKKNFARKAGINVDFIDSIPDSVSTSAISNLMTQYPDAGILPTDDIATAQGKLQNSKLYQQEIGITPTPLSTPELVNAQYINPTTDPAWNDYLSAYGGNGNVSVNFGGKTKFENYHPGVDIALPKGTPVLALKPGTVIETGNNNAYGNYVKVQDEQGNVWQYGHLDDILVKEGQIIPPSSQGAFSGKVLGRAGNTGQTYSVTGGDGSHLDLRVIKGSANNPDSVDPIKLLETVDFSSASNREYAMNTVQEKLNQGNIAEAQDFALKIAWNNVDKDVKTSITSFASANGLLGTIEELARNAITAESSDDISDTVLDVAGQAIDAQISALTRTDPEMAVFLTNVKTFSSLLTRAAGEKGVLTDKDVQRIIDGLPKITDTKEIADLKLQTFRNLFQSAVDGSLAAYNVDPAIIPSDVRNLLEQETVNPPDWMLNAILSERARNASVGQRIVDNETGVVATKLEDGNWDFNIE